MWANGNGGPADDCAADGYATSIYTISVGAIGVDGRPSPFDEECSAKMVTNYVTDPDGRSAVVICSFIIIVSNMNDCKIMFMAEYNCFKWTVYKHFWRNKCSNSYGFRNNRSNTGSKVSYA